MKKKPILLLALLVILPLTLLAWAGMRLAGHERMRVEQQIRELLADRLRDLDRHIVEHFTTLAADLQRVTSIDDYDIEHLREIVRNDPRLFQLFVIEADGALLYPNPQGPLTQTERDFILRASQIINDHQLQRTEESTGDGDFKSRPSLGPMSGARPSRSLQSPPDTVFTVPQPGAWHVWYWGPGMNLIYWQRRENGHIVGVALERSRWIADLIADLPDTPVLSPSSNLAPTESRIRLVESGTETIYQWGRFDPPEHAEPACEIRLSEPLLAWQLQTFVPMKLITAGTGSGIYVNVVAGLAISGIALAALAFIFYQQYARDMREAVQRVSFVNQVSHELRTPLTNIRMYAELLGSDLETLDQPTDEPRRRLGVIISESQRLSRLIGNVLTFAREERNTLQLSPKPCVVDQIIREVLSSFRPSLDQKRIQAEIDLQASEPVLADSDALEQILGNLINNVEKYAAEGKWLRISSRQQKDHTVVTVADRGPGIADQHRNRVFEPFWRTSHELNQAAGTGIGLTIARHLARLHGGDVRLQSSGKGAVFEVELWTPTTKGENI